MLDGFGQFADTIIGTVGGIFASREQRRIEEARLAQANVAASALSADNLARFRTIALVVFGAGALWFLTRRLRAG